MGELDFHFSIPTELLEALPPDPATLLEVLCDRITEPMIVEIAESEMPFSYEEHYDGVRKIVRDRRIFEGLSWEPAEALSLISWTAPESPDGHIIRAFSCTCLLSQELYPALEAKLPALVLSILDLADPDVRDATPGFLTHLLLHMDLQIEAFCVTAFCLTALLTLDPILREHADIEGMTEWVSELDSEARRMSIRNPSAASFAQLSCATQSLELQELAGRLAQHSVDNPVLRDLSLRVGEPRNMPPT